MDDAEASGHTGPEVMLAAAQRARDRANAARWDLNVATALFAVLIVVIILVSQDARLEIVGPIAVVGLAAAWLTGWRKGRRLYRRFYDEELSGLQRESSSRTGETAEEAIEARVQKALRERMQPEFNTIRARSEEGSVMPIDSTWHVFTDEEIEKAPEFFGVYGLYEGTETIYYGKAEGPGGIKGRLESHKAGREGRGTMAATYFNCERCPRPAIRERELLDEHMRQFGRLPRCNEVRR